MFSENAVAKRKRFLLLHFLKSKSKHSKTSEKVHKISSPENVKNVNENR